MDQHRHKRSVHKRVGPSIVINAAGPPFADHRHVDVRSVMAQNSRDNETVNWKQSIKA
jgi:hypothetical protein